MYHAVCREYIPNGDKLNNEEVDEVWTWSFAWRRRASHANMADSMPPDGLPSTASACRSILPAVSASWLPRTVSGSMERFWASTAVHACKPPELDEVTGISAGVGS
jgi:hypothetical protein